MSFEPGAQAFYNVLEAIFDYADDNFEPKGLGLMTIEKEKMLGDISSMNELVAACRDIPIAYHVALYRIMGCQIHMIPSYDPSVSPFEFREPDQPALTKAGWIKSEVINMLINSGPAYTILQAYIATFNLHIKDPEQRCLFPGGRYGALPQRSTVEWYARSLASELGIVGIEEMVQTMQTYHQGWMQTQLAIEQSVPRRDVWHNREWTSNPW